jgi:hypothetical protein
LKQIECKGVNWSKNKKFWEELIASFPWYDTGHIENDASNNPTSLLYFSKIRNVG